MDLVTSQKGVPIRLTEERWFHIVENHDKVDDSFLVTQYKSLEDVRLPSLNPLDNLPVASLLTLHQLTDR